MHFDIGYAFFYAKAMQRHAAWGSNRNSIRCYLRFGASRMVRKRRSKRWRSG